MNLIDKSDEEIINLATPIMDNLMEGSTEINYEKHVLNHTERAKKAIPKDELERQCKKYQSEFGLFSERKVMGVTRHKNYVNIVWKQKMSKSSNEFLAVLSLV